MTTLYDELGLTPSATNEEIHSAYRKLVRQFHPDRNAGFEKQAKERFQRIQHAFDVLSNPVTREKYDETLGPSRFSAGPPSLVTDLPEINVGNRPRRKRKTRPPVLALVGLATAIVMAIVTLIALSPGADDKQSAQRALEKLPPKVTSPRSRSVDSKNSEPVPTEPSRSQLAVEEPAYGFDESASVDMVDDVLNDESDVAPEFPDVRSSSELEIQGEPDDSDLPYATYMPREARAPTKSTRASNPLINNLVEALDANDKKNVIAAVEALRAADGRLSEVQPIVQQLLSNIDAASQESWRPFRIDDSQEVAKIIWVVGAAGKDVDWVLDYLLSAQKRFDTLDQPIEHAAEPVSRWYPFNRVLADDYVKVIANADARRELTRLLSESYAKDRRVGQMFDEQIERLKTAPEPRDRASAALWLSRSSAISEVTVPALLDAIKSDVSIEVKRAALVSLAGFNDPPASVTAVIDKGVDYFKDYDTQVILLSSLSSGDSESPLFKRIVIDRLSSYKSRNRGTQELSSVCTALYLLETSPSWAIPQLISAAEVAIAADRRFLADFHQLTEVLLKVGVGDSRVTRFYERAAKEGPEGLRVHCDSIAKRLKKAP
jgi:hypothetical protein